LIAELDFAVLPEDLEPSLNMNVQKCLTWVGALLIVGFILAGCGKAGGKVDAQAFDKAPPEIKADWDAAVAADKANDYFTASIAYAKVMKQEAKLTPAQFDSVLTASRDLSQRLTTAAASGDAAAKAALAKLMASQKR
jgi:hypothetical protein